MKALRQFALWLAASLALAAAAGVRAQDACPAAGCKVENGAYRVVLPEKPAMAGRIGAILFFHGWQGSAEETLADQKLVAVAQRLGVALIAPDGMGHTWSYPGSPGHYRDEFRFVTHVLDDAVARFALDPGRIMASGFSQGASMVWYLACRMPTRFAAFVPVAGAFWEPLPPDCAGPRPALVHVHGASDTTVPLAGRSLRNGYHQGDTFRSLEILAPGCTANWAQTRQTPPAEGLACRLATDCSGTARLELCLHAGGHVFDPAWIERAWRLAMPVRAPITAGGPAQFSVKP